MREIEVREQTLSLLKKVRDRDKKWKEEGVRRCFVEGKSKVYLKIDEETHRELLSRQRDGEPLWLTIEQMLRRTFLNIPEDC